MKKVICLICALVLTLTTAAFAAEILVGGWSVADSEEIALPEDAADAFEKALEGLAGCTYKPVALLGTQVVAGTNYCILCELTPVVPNPVSYYALVYIYADLQGNAQITNVAELDIAELATPPIEE
ncbi:MAG: hypothetical protein IKO07_13595 [Clostridia bacterium]|nr:hypothetical protein [Clostridia bacterium]